MNAGIASPSNPNPGLWILDPWRDLALFVLTPLWILPLVWLAKARFGINSFGVIALGLGAVGHHLPGFIRAYTNPLLFHRFRLRFILAPAFFLSVAVAFSLLHLHGLQVILLLWGAWHGAMQVNGFLRIYDAKAGSHAPRTARLDRAVCLLWFGAGVLHSPSRMIAILTYFYGAGGGTVVPELFTAFRAAWDVVTAGVTALFLFNAWRQARAGLAPSPVKFLLMISSFAFWWFAMVVVENPILGLLLFEIFHDIQYNALVWVYNRGRITQGQSISRVESFLFRPGAFPILFYALLVAGYGALGVLSGYSGVQAPDLLRSTLGSVNVWTTLFTVSVFLHYYFDGFIWRVRDEEFRQDLGIGGGIPDAAVSSPRAPAGRLMGWKWAFFVLPVVVLGTLELRGRSLPMRDRYENMVQLLPDNWTAHYLLAGAEVAAGQPDQAAAHYARSVALNPEFQLAQVQLANLLLSQGRVGEALPYMMASAERAPNDTNLAYLTGAALMHEHRPAEAVPYLQRTLQLNPLQPRAWSYLSIAAGLLGDSAAAEEYFRRAYALDPQNARRL